MIVIFDLDGTVWDSAEGIVGSLEHTFASFGLEVPDRSVLAANLGPPLQLMLAELGIPAELVDDATLRYRERYVEWGAYQSSLYPGVLDAIDELAAAGHRLATATSKGEGPTRQMLEHFAITDRFEVIGAATMDATAITKSAVLARTLDALGAPAAPECWMVGDRSYDVTGAASFGISCIGVAWGYGSAEELRSAGARHVIDRPDQLPPLVG